jgi:hypothetical protein
VLGLTAEWSGYGWGDPGHWIPDLAVGWCLIGCGFIASARRPESRSGVLMSATGFTWFLGNFAGVGVSVVAWVAAHALYLHRGPLFQLLLTYPDGRRHPDRRADTVGGGDPVRVVVAEDIMLTREGIIRLLRDAGIDVVAQAGDAEALLREVRTE